MSLISFAHAADAAAAPSPIGGILPLILIFVVFYFLLIRPQQKKFKEHQSMVASLRRGDKIVTSGGVVGTITKVDNEADILHVEVATDVVIQVVRGTVASVVNRTGDAEVEAPKKPKGKKKAA